MMPMSRAEIARRYRERHKDDPEWLARRAAYMKQWHAEHADPEVNRARVKRWREENPERARQMDHEKYQRRLAENPDRVREKGRHWREANRDRAREQSRRWARKDRAANPVIYLGGEAVRVSALPEKLRPIAHLINETRREMRRSAHRA